MYVIIAQFSRTHCTVLFVFFIVDGCYISYYLLTIHLFDVTSSVSFILCHKLFDMLFYVSAVVLRLQNCDIDDF